jgi:superfamily II DNA helicase RecQ
VDASFEKDGKSINFRKVHLTREGHDADGSVALEIKESVRSLPKGRKGKKKKAPAKKAAKPAALKKTPALAEAVVEKDLRAWRLAEAKKRGVPAFRIMKDDALKGIAYVRPGTAMELLAIPGVGLGFVEKYGAQIFRILHEGQD